MTKIKILNFSFEYSVGSIIYKVENGRFLFLLLHYRSGHWDLVKGHKEENESDLQTLRREALEEVGLTDLRVVANFKKCSYYFYKAKGSEKTKRIKEGRGINIFKKVVFYLAKSDKGELDIERINKSHEIQGCTWVPYEKAKKRITHDRQKKMFKEAMDLLQKA